MPPPLIACSCRGHIHHSCDPASARQPSGCSPARLRCVLASSSSWRGPAGLHGSSYEAFPSLPPRPFRCRPPAPARACWAPPPLPSVSRALPHLPFFNSPLCGCSPPPPPTTAPPHHPAPQPPLLPLCMPVRRRRPHPPTLGRSPPHSPFRETPLRPHSVPLGAPLSLPSLQTNAWTPPPPPTLAAPWPCATPPRWRPAPTASRPAAAAPRQPALPRAAAPAPALPPTPLPLPPPAPAPGAERRMLALAACPRQWYSHARAPC